MANAQVDGQRRVATRASQHKLAIPHHPNNRVVYVTHDRAIMHKKDVGNACQALERFLFVSADRLVTKIPAGGNHWKPKLAQEQMMQRRVGKHHAEVRVSWCDGGAKSPIKRRIPSGAAAQSAIPAKAADAPQAAKPCKSRGLLLDDGYITAKGFSSRRFRRRSRATAASSRAFTIN